MGYTALEFGIAIQQMIMDFNGAIIESVEYEGDTRCIVKAGVQSHKAKEFFTEYQDGEWQT